MSNLFAPHCTADETEIDLSAFNAAFYELGLRWHWDIDTYEALAANTCERTRVRRYLETEQAHILRAYDAEFLTDAILSIKHKCRQRLAKSPLRSASRHSWAEARGER